MRRVFCAKDGERVLLGNKGLMLIRVLALAAVAACRGQASPYFSDSEKSKIANFWNANGRYYVAAPAEAKSSGPWQVRLSPEGSAWLYKYNSIRGVGKGATGRTEPISAEEQREWENWVNARVAYDRWEAANAAAEANSRFLGRDVGNNAPEPSDPGPQPARLRTLVGEAPSLASAVAPNQYFVTFPDGCRITLLDNPQMTPKNPAYRFPQGVRSSGVPVSKMSPDELNALFNEAGADQTAQKVMKAVSVLEGGFDSINTYDTGYVSVGVIQFACLSKGAGSLGAVLLKEKTDNPRAFDEDFRQYGLDVTSAGALVALDIDSGSVREGSAAARQIISDKRLIAVFQHAGQKSRSFQVAQISTALDQYYPANDVVTVNVNGKVVSGRIGEFIHSEAGLATLMDRKVNTGNYGALPNVLAQVGSNSNCTCAADFASHEREIVAAMKFRKDYLQDPELSQPGIASPRTTTLPSRHGSRGGRGGHRRA